MPRPPTSRRRGSRPERSHLDSPSLGEVYTGRFQSGHRAGGFVVLETPGMKDVFVPTADCGSALHGDEVRVLVVGEGRARAPEGEIDRVLRHANRRVVGRLSRGSRGISVVRPKNAKLDRWIKINRQFSADEVPEDAWVIVEITKYSGSRDEPLTGKLVEVLGVEGDRRLPILLLIRDKGVTPEFTPEVEEEAARIAQRKIGEKEVARRRDFRTERVMTIDPATAKDFDDAISLVEKTPDGWRVAVHIADVAHYVSEGSKIDLEAYARATSVYPVDRVIPMLPEALSNGQCSLRPGEEKFTMTAIFSIDSTGRVSAEELCETVILSARRFTYEEVQGIFDDIDGVPDSVHPRPKLPRAIEADLLELRRASAALRKARMGRGSLDLDMPEPEILFNDEGLVEDVRRKESIESNRLIEDFMITANEVVARALTKAHMPVLYRVHEEPREEKLRALAPALARFGVGLPAGGGIDRGALGAALAKAKAHPAGVIAQRWVLRAMMRAKYQGENLGHYGLASECYSHFTSPIRRYPDLIAHRAIKALLRGKGSAAKWREATKPRLAEWGRHISAKEEDAQRIEWDAEKILTLEFMRQFLGDIFDGYIGGVSGKGFFVELSRYPAEGFVPIRTVEGEYYDLDKDSAAWFGRSSGHVLAVGDRVRVQIESIDVLAGEMNLLLIRKDTKAKGRSAHVHAGHPRNKHAYDWRKHVKKGRRRG